MRKVTAGLADAKEISTGAAGAAVLSESCGSFHKLEEVNTGANCCRFTRHQLWQESGVKHSQTLLLCTKGKPLAATAAC